MSENTQGKGPEIIPPKSDDPIVRMEHAVERIIEQTDGKLSKIDERLKGIEDSFVQSRARLQVLEDRNVNPSRQYVSPYAESQAKRREAARWLVDLYRYTSTTARDTSDGMEWRANQSSTTTEGGFLVPKPVLPEVLRVVETHGVARRICRVIPMDRDKLDITKKNAGPTVSWQSSEGAAASASGATFTNGTLDSDTLITLDEITMQVQDDAVVDIASYVIDLFGEAVAKEEDKQAFNSTSPFTGLLQTSGTGVHTIASTTFTGNLTYNDFRKTLFKADAFVVNRGTWLMSTDLMSEVMGIVDSNGRPLFSSAMPPGDGVAAGPGTILGRPVVLSEAMPKAADDASGLAVLAYGDFSKLLIGDRRQLSFDFDDSTGFKSATRWLRVMERVAFITGVPAAFGVLKTA